MFDLRAYNDTIFRVDEVLEDVFYKNVSFEKGFFYHIDEINEKHYKATFDLENLPIEPNFKEPLKTHFLEGTSKSLSLALKASGLDINIKQWYEYSGKPYHFKASINASKTGVNFSDLKRLDEIIKEYKNARSICEKVEISQSIEVVQKNKSAFISGEEVKLLPYQITNLSTNFKNKTLSSFYQDEIIDLRSK